MSSVNTDPLLNSVDAAAYLGLAVRTLEQWRLMRQGPVYCKVGHRVRYRQSALDSFIREVDPANPHA